MPRYFKCGTAFKCKRLLRRPWKLHVSAGSSDVDSSCECMAGVWGKQYDEAYVPVACHHFVWLGGGFVHHSANGVAECGPDWPTVGLGAQLCRLWLGPDGNDHALIGPDFVRAKATVASLCLCRGAWESDPADQAASHTDAEVCLKGCGN